MELYYYWILAGVIFLIIEILSFTFYGLSLAVGAFITATFVYFSGDTGLSLLQSMIFIFVSSGFAVFATKYLRPSKKAMPVGLDSYIGTIAKLEKIGDDWKIKIDGVDYLVADESVEIDFGVGKKVKILEHNSGVFKVELV